jgi:hypothetical protein
MTTLITSMNALTRRGTLTVMGRFGGMIPLPETLEKSGLGGDGVEERRFDAIESVEA